MSSLSIRVQMVLAFLFVEMVTILIAHLHDDSTHLILFEIFLGAVVAWLVSGYFSSPISKLTLATERFFEEFPLLEDSKEIKQLSSSIRDMQTKINQSNWRISNQLETIDKYVITSSTDLNGVITDVSSAYCMLCGYTKEELIGNSHRILRHPDVPKATYKELWETIKSGKTWHGEIQNMNKKGEVYWLDATITPVFNEQNEIVGYYSVSHDITAEKQATYMATTDALTKVANRLKLDEVFLHELSVFERYGTPLSIILADIDHFKQVNDNYGHTVGDMVLKEVARRLKSNIRAADTLGRWGGEEFMIICPQTNEDEAVLLAEKLRAILCETPFPEVGFKSGSFGVTGTVCGEKPTSVVARADKALYLAKDGGRNRVCLVRANKQNQQDD